MQPFTQRSRLVRHRGTDWRAALVLGPVCLALTSASSAAQFKAPTGEEQQHYHWLSERLSEAQSIKVGMSRADLLKVFLEDGGLQRIPAERYVLRSCSLIKVNVRFDVPSQTPRAGLPPDDEMKIVAISKPYLEIPDAD